MIGQQLLCTASLVTTLVLVTSCQQDTNPVATIEISPDLSFSIGPIAMPDSGAIARSVVSKGNRYRLGKFIRKARKGASLRVGCIGGSITQGARASCEELRYANRFCQLLEDRYPKSSFSTINAGIGATNSRFACSRVQQDLLDQKPDLILIEFAVNDDPRDSILTVESMEGLVRQCLRPDSVPVIMLFTMNNTGDTTVSHIHSMVGRHYNLPILSYRNAIWPYLASAQISWDLLSPDAVHPNNSGHLLIGYLLYCFVEMTDRDLDTMTFSSVPIPSPISTDLYESAGVYALSSDSPIEVFFNKGWAETDKEFDRIGYSSITATDSIVFRISSKELTIGYYYSMKRDGLISVRVDNQIPITLSNHFADDWGSGCMLLHQVFRQQQKQKNRLRTITITNMTNSRFEIQYLLYAG